MRILVVDDSQLELELAKALLMKLGYLDVITAMDAREACEYVIGSSPPQILLIDWMMPETSGLELCRIIRNTELPVNPYLIVMTSNGESDAEDTALIKGADEFIRKPLQIRGLSARIRAAERMIETQLALHEANRKLEVLTLLDDYTGLLNRHAGLAALNSSLSRLQRNPGTSGALIMCDIDNYSRIIELDGHAQADKVISEFSGKLKSILRPTDWTCRYSGEEFMIFIEGGRNQLPAALNRLISQTASSVIIGEEEISLCLNVGCLVIQSHSAHIALDDLLSRVDQALSEVKRHNACSFYLDEIEEVIPDNVIDFSARRSKQSN